MAKAGAELSPEKEVKAPPAQAEPSATDNTAATGSDAVRDTSSDASPRALLMNQALTTYAEGAVAQTRPIVEGATTGADGFTLTDDDAPVVAATELPENGASTTASPAEKASTAEKKVDVAAYNPVASEAMLQGLPKTLFGVEINAEDLINDKSTGDVNLGLGESYEGGFLKMNVRPINYEVKPGETLEQIARKHLGPGATQEQVDVHVDEIVEANKKTLKGADYETYAGKKGDVLRLPGHTADGADLFKDHRGTITRVTEDGKVRVTYLDGTGFERTPDADGGITKKYFGTKPEDNYTVKLDKDGKVLVNDRVDPNHKPAADLASETKRLEDLADKGLGIKSEREQFKKDMQEFIKTARKNGLPESEVAQTFAEVARILEAGGPKQPMTSRERARLAIGIMRGAAYPDSGNQGMHNTCSMSWMENRFYAREPATNARLLADVATTGKFVASDGTVVRMDPSDLRAHGEGAQNAGRGLNVRGYASQIFQVAAGNTFHTRNNEGRVPPGDMRYAQVKPRDANDSGERLIDYAKTPGAGRTTIGDAATVSGINDTAYLISGKQEANVFIASEHMVAQDSKNPASAGFGNAEELIEKLKEAKADGKPLSVGIGIYSNADPFYSIFKAAGITPFDGKPGVERFTSDLHAVRVVGFNEKDMTVQVDNQWGDENDMISKPISVYELYNATNRASANTWMSRLDGRWDSQDDATNAAHLKSIMGANFLNWAVERESSGLPIDRRDMDLAMEKYNRMVDRLPADLQRDVRKAVEQYNKDWDLVRTMSPPKPPREK
jgi:hypothetical protein